MRTKTFCFLLFVFSGAVWAEPLEIEIVGIEGELLQNVRLFLSVMGMEGRDVRAGAAEDSDDESSISEFDLERLHRNATSEIRDALEPFGHYRPAIDASLTRDAERWVARYAIDPGPPTRLGEVRIEVVGEGKDFPLLREALANIELKGGDPLVHSRFERAKSSLYDTAYAAGYLSAEWKERSVQVHPDRRQADVGLVLDTGPRFYFGEVTFEQSVLNRELLHRFVRFRPGDPYNTQRLLDLQLALNDSQYFGHVEIKPQRELAGEDHRVPISVTTIPVAPEHYTVGVGFATDTGPRLTIGAILRRLNRAGHRLRADLQLSAIESALAARYEIPIENVATDTLAFTASAKQQEVGDAETDQFLLGVSRDEGWLGFRRQLYLNLQRENFQFGEGPQQKTDLLFPGVTLSRQRTDDVQYPRRGYNLTVDLRGAAEGVLSDATFVRLDVDARWIRAIAENARLLLHGGMGMLDTSSFDVLPPSQRFFTGGDRSLRGYGYQEVGTRNAEGAVIGGEYLLLGSAEVEYLFYKDYGAALFVDAGDAFRDSPDLKTGAGLGFRWRSPIGMVRLDLAHPFDDPDDNFRIHLSIGPDLL
jgi:translocation and assembly module TamA